MSNIQIFTVAMYTKYIDDSTLARALHLIVSLDYLKEKIAGKVLAKQIYL